MGYGNDLAQGGANASEQRAEAFENRAFQMRDANEAGSLISLMKSMMLTIVYLSMASEHH